MEIEARTPVFVATVHLQHGDNITRNKHTIATVLSCLDDRCHVIFKDNSTAFIGTKYLELATEESHSDARGWKQHLIHVEEMKNRKLEEFDKALIDLCKKHNVVFSLANGEVVFVDLLDPDNDRVLDQQCQL